MLTATLGGLIKDYRIKKRLSQLEVSLRIGWKDTTRLSKIEQGRVGRPIRKTLDKIMDALDLNEQEKNMMLLSSGTLPSDSEVRGTITKLKKEMKQFQTPVILVDYAWRVFYFNKEAKKIFKISNQNCKTLIKKNPNWLELLFLYKDFFGVNIKEGYTQENILESFEHEIALFKYEQKNNTGEKWFRDLMSRLSQSDEFRKLWMKIDVNRYEHLLYEYEFHTITSNWQGGEETLAFHVFNIHPTFDFRFYLMIYTPANEHTFKFYQNTQNS